MARTNGLFTIDGMEYRVQVKEGGLKRGFKITDSEHSGRVQNYSMHRDVVGTFYNYTLEINPDPSYRGDYDAFYDVVSAPVQSHTMVFPYGQEALEFKAYVTSGEDSLSAREKDGQRVNRWSGLSLNFIAMEPQRRP